MLADQLNLYFTCLGEGVGDIEVSGLATIQLVVDSDPLDKKKRADTGTSCPRRHGGVDVSYYPAILYNSPITERCFYHDVGRPSRVVKRLFCLSAKAILTSLSRFAHVAVEDFMEALYATLLTRQVKALVTCG